MAAADPTSTCNGKSVSLADLLAETSSSGQAALVRAYAAHAVSEGVPFVLGESNSASCGGQENVSDTLSAALWSVDYLLSVAEANVSRVNFHGGGSSSYSWVGAFHDTGVPDVRPLFYGMWVASEALKGETRLVELGGTLEPAPVLAGHRIVHGLLCSFLRPVRRDGV